MVEESLGVPLHLAMLSYCYELKFTALYLHLLPLQEAKLLFLPLSYHKKRRFHLDEIVSDVCPPTWYHGHCEGTNNDHRYATDTSIR